MNTVAAQLHDRQFPARVVKDCCCIIYGAKIHNNTWQNWRSWIGVGKRKRTFTWTEFCLFAAIARIRAKQENKRLELDLKDIKVLAQSPDFQEEIKLAVEYMDSQDKVLGKDAALKLATLGIDVSLTTLWRKVPNFSTVKVYDVNDLQKHLNTKRKI